MKKLLFSFLFLLQMGTIRTMDPGLNPDPRPNENPTITNPKPNNSIINKIQGMLLWPLDAFTDWHEYMRNEWTPGFDFSTLFVGLAGTWGIYALTSIIYMKTVVGTSQPKGSLEIHDQNRKIIEAFLQRSDHSKFQKFMIRFFLNPLFGPVKK